MKIIYKRSLKLFLIFCIFILSLGIVSASNNIDLINDIQYLTVDRENTVLSDFDDDVDLGGFNDINSISDCKLVNLDNNKYIYEKTKSSDDNYDFRDLQALLDNASDNDEIQLNGTYVGNSPIILNKSLTLKSKSGATLDGGFLTKIMDINASNIILENISFINGNYTALNVNGNNVTLKNCLFDNNVNGELGSALSISGNNFNIINSNFTNNVANKSSCHHTDGAAINLVGNNANIIGCNFENNWGYNYETASSGGAIWMKGNNILINNSKFLNNSAQSKFGWTLHGEEETYLADGLGGSIFITGNKIKILNSLFIDSLSHANGGALYYKSAYDCLIYNSTFINCSSVGEGGVIYLAQNVYSFTIDSSRFINNTAEGLDGVLVKYTNNGSVIYSDKYTGDIDIINSSLFDNNGASSVYFMGSNLNVSDSIIKSNNLSTAVIFTNGTLNDNFWSQNIYSIDDFRKSNMIVRNNEQYAPDNWVNLEISGLDNLNKKGNYDYDLYFVLNDGKLEKSLPDYSLNIKNSGKNLISSSNIILENNFGQFNYYYNDSSKDIVNVYDDYGDLILSKIILSGIIFINDTGNGTKDLKDAIDNAENGSLILLSNKTYIIDTIQINKDISISGAGSTIIILSNSSDYAFNISGGLNFVRISNIEFLLDNGDTVALAEAINSTNSLTIDVPEIIILDNNFSRLDDDVLSQSIRILQLDSERGILAPTNSIVVSNNSLESGMDPFKFNVKSINNGSDVKIKIGGNVPLRKSSVLVCGDMYTKAICPLDSRSGEYFNVGLKDADGHVLQNKSVKIGFNGKIYNRTTNASGEVNLQINLPKKGTYTFAVSFLGDIDYNASFGVVKIVVISQKPSLIANNVIYKTNSKTKTISAYLKSMKGTALRGKRINFVVNGKTHITTTNSKGIASVKVSLNKKGTYKFVAKFNGDNTFATVSKTAKIIIK